MKAGKEMLLWPDGPGGKNGAPGAVGDGPLDRPTLRVYLPTVPNPTRTSVVVAPGGAYAHLSMNKEGEDIALWLNERGVAAFVLRYRLGPTYHHPVEIEDAHRAIRTVRARAAEYGIAADHVGMWGFSAGGHLTATAGTRYDGGDPGSADPIERVGSRPDFLVLSYPVITLEAPLAHAGSRKYLLGDTPDPALVTELSAENKVTSDTPPTFLFATTDDGSVPVLNSVMFYEALVKAKVPAELHLYQHGPHGVGLAPGFPDLKGWPDLLARWMRARGLMGQPETR
jgi:acetyl esterase/lipase